MTKAEKSVLKQGHLLSFLAAIQRPGHREDNCKIVYYKSRLKKLAGKLILQQLGEPVEKRTNLRFEGKPINN